MRWVFRYDDSIAPPNDLGNWSENLEISPHLARFLWARGMRSKEEMEAFIAPFLGRLAPIDSWPGLREAASLLVDALLAGKKICVWGDYDVDGITSTALVKEILGKHGFECLHYIPNRLLEGYGLNKEAISTLAEQGVDILLTVDSGISDIEAITHAKSLGMMVIVSDHHLPGENLPPADVIVNPRLVPCPYPFLAGVGVAFMFMAAVNSLLHEHGKPRQDMRDVLDLVALGTLADVVDLQGANRILVKNGLLKIAEAGRAGVAALKSVCNFAPKAVLGSGQVVFTLAPRINAAGRLGSSEIALELLLCSDMGRAMELAGKLNALNTQRRSEEDGILEEALEKANAQVDEGRMGLVLYGADWHPGVIGIVASRIVESLHRPTVVLSATEDFLKGSGRSINGFDLHEAFGECSHLLLGYGGHYMAAGLSLMPDNLEEFARLFDALVAEGLGVQVKEPVCKLDGELDFALAADFVFLKELELLQPFGTGNSEPVFCSGAVKVKEMRPRTNLMLLDLEDPKTGLVLKAKAWRNLANMPTTLKNKLIRIAFTPRIDRYNGVASVELRLKDWKEEV